MRICYISCFINKQLKARVRCRSVIEYANNIRFYVTAQAMHDNRIQMQERFQALLAEVTIFNVMFYRMLHCMSSVARTGRSGLQPAGQDDGCVRRAELRHHVRNQRAALVLLPGPFLSILTQSHCTLHHVFVQAYYYETMENCPSGAKPSFAAGPQELLFRLNTAIAAAGSFSRLSSANLTLTIRVQNKNIYFFMSI